MGLFLENGYLNVPYLAVSRLPFVFVVGGRGTGKTYGALDWVRAQAMQGGKFIYLRRSQKTVDKIVSSSRSGNNAISLSPFKTLDRDRGYTTEIVRVATDVHAFVDGDSGTLLGYCLALSTFAGLRGFDANEVTTIIFDEFIPEQHEKPIANEAEAFFNAVETVNRNRELQGHPPVKCLLFSNANRMGNPLFLELGLVSRATKMQEKHIEMYRDEERGLMLVILQNSPVSEKKKETALYKLTAGSSFSKMSVENDFDERCSNLRHVSLKELVPLVTVGEITIYRHKSGNWLYVSTHKTGSPETFTSSAADLKRFKLHFMWVWESYMYRQVYFEEYLCELLLDKYFHA